MGLSLSTQHALVHQILKIIEVAAGLNIFSIVDHVVLVDIAVGIDQGTHL